MEFSDKEYTLMFELNFLPVMFVCFTANLRKTTLTNWDPDPVPHPSKHCVLTTRLTHVTQKSNAPSPGQLDCGPFLGRASLLGRVFRFSTVSMMSCKIIKIDVIMYVHVD